MAERYEGLIAAVLAELAPDERVLRAWRMSTCGPRRHITDVGLLVATDRQVIGADQGAKSAGVFRLPTHDIAVVKLVNRRIGGSDLNWEIHLLGAGGEVLGPSDSPAAFALFAAGRDPSRWDSHLRGEQDLAPAQRALAGLLPHATPGRGELVVATVAAAPPPGEPETQPPGGRAPEPAPAAPADIADIVLAPTAAAPSPGVRPRLEAIGGATVRPGGTLSFLVASDPWPDPKLAEIEVTLAYQSTVLVLVTPQPATPFGQLIAPPGPVMGEGTASGGTTDVAVVARGTAPADRLGGAGQLAGSVVVPTAAPPTIEGIVGWRLAATFKRRRGLDHHAVVAVTVSGLGAEQAEQLAALRTPAGEDGSDWIIRVCEVPYQPYGARLAPVVRPRDIWVDLATPIVEPGGRLAGTVIVRPDAELLAATARKYRSAAETTGQIELSALRVVLECWRGSPERQTCHRMFQADSQITGPLTLSWGETRAVPFEITVPTSARLLKSHGSWTAEQPIPATFAGTRAGGATVDDIRWRLVGQIVPAGRSPREPSPSSALWGATEVLVTEPPADAG